MHADKAQPGIIAGTAAGFEFDLAQAEKPRQRLLLDTDILNSLERNRTRAAAQHTLFNPDVILTDKIAKARQCEPTEKQAEKQNAQNDDRNKNGTIGLAGAEYGGEKRKYQLGQSRDKANQYAGYMQPLSIIGRGLAPDGKRLAHIASCRIAARMVSRMASASAWRSPGSVTRLL